MSTKQSGSFALQRVFVIDGNRTPFLKVKGKPGPFTAADLALNAAQPLFLRQPLLPSQVNEVIIGSVMPSSREANIARIVGLRLGCGNHVPAYTVQRNCASGMQALDSAFRTIQSGHANIILAGGTEAMSHAPFLLSIPYINWLAEFRSAKTFKQHATLLLRFRPHFLKPVNALMNGLNDPVVGLSMGQTAENLAYQFHITRRMMDEYTLLSHQRLAAAVDQGLLANEISPIIDREGNTYVADDGLRRDTSLEKLAKLPAYFDRPFGSVTAGNSSQVTDGAAILILASERAVEKYQLSVLGEIIDSQWAALAPEIMGLGPIHAMTPLLQRHQMQIDDIAAYEINEAFAAQIIACKLAWENDEYCQRYLNLPKAMGNMELARVNMQGGGISLGHPVGASGARIVLHLLHQLRQQQATWGMAGICIGGGQGGAMLLKGVSA